MKPMKRHTLVISIQKPVAEVFAFVLDPANTPRWVDLIVEEEASEWPPREGTVYRNKNREGTWNEYSVTSFEQNKTFIMKMKDGNYHVQYTFRPAADNSTELEYYEWVIRGTLPEPFRKETLMKLKTVLE